MVAEDDLFRDLDECDDDDALLLLLVFDVAGVVEATW